VRHDIRRLDVLRHQERRIDRRIGILRKPYRQRIADDWLSRQVGFRIDQLRPERREYRKARVVIDAGLGKEWPATLERHRHADATRHRELHDPHARRVDLVELVNL
jgi:hypothetical protein